jgi:hypothetical protein
MLNLKFMLHFQPYAAYPVSPRSDLNSCDFLGPTEQVIPRFKGDDLTPPWSVKVGDPNNIQAAGETLRRAMAVAK